MHTTFILKKRAKKIVESFHSTNENDIGLAKWNETWIPTRVHVSCSCSSYISLAIPFLCDKEDTPHFAKKKSTQRSVVLLAIAMIYDTIQAYKIRTGTLHFVTMRMDYANYSINMLCVLLAESEQFDYMSRCHNCCCCCCRCRRHPALRRALDRKFATNIHCE